MKKKVNKTREISSIYMYLFIVFAVYFISGYFIIYKTDLTRFYDFWYSSDCPRVWGDLTKVVADHYRITVHPLYIIICQPIFRLLNGIFVDSRITVIVMNSILATANSYFVYKICTLFTCEIYSILISLIYGFSFSSLVFSSVTETFIVSALFLILLWYKALSWIMESKENNANNTLNDRILIALGVLNFGITLTNFSQFMIA